MSCGRTARIRARLLEGGALTSDERRHVATCPACGRAAAAVDRLDARLRDAARPLAVEPIPNEVFDVAPVDRSPIQRLAFGGGLGVVAAIVAVLAVLTLGSLRGPVAVDPTPTSSPTPSAAPPQSPAPATPTPQPTPIPSPPEVDAHLVGPLSSCADGTAGFSVFLPRGWYANRASGEQPACRTFGPVRDVHGRQNLDPAIYLDVADEPPTFDESTIEDEVHRTVASGVMVTRMNIRVPESGALAASDEVVYLAPLADGRTLIARTDARRPAWVTALDAIIERLALSDPIVIDPAAVAEAERLFADRDVCEDPERGLAVVFPDAWWTNTAVDDLPACSWFAPSSFESVSPDAIPDEVEVTIDLYDASYGTIYETVAADSMTLLGHPASRWVLEAPRGRWYEYMVALGNAAAEEGPTLVARTAAAPDDLDLAMAVLDELVARMTMADPPPGASSAEPYIDAPPVSAEDTADDFRLELVAAQDRYRAGQPILADVTLTYVGDTPVRVWGSSHSLIGTTVRQLDGPIDPGMAFTSDCVAYDIGPGAPMRGAVGKSGSFDGDEPLAEWYEAYFRDPLLRLPAGRWEVVAATSFTVGGDDCGAGPQVGLRATVEIVVEP